MKRIKNILTIALLLGSLNIFANNPYMHLTLVYKGGKTVLFTIDENGVTSEVKLKSISNGFSVSPDKVIGIQKEVQEQLNLLAQKGWRVVAVSNLNNPTFLTVNYLLEKSEEEKEE